VQLLENTFYTDCVVLFSGLNWIGVSCVPLEFTFAKDLVHEASERVALVDLVVTQQLQISTYMKLLELISLNKQKESLHYRPLNFISVY
jgi:hypothetical protein